MTTLNSSATLERLYDKYKFLIDSLNKKSLYYWLVKFKDWRVLQICSKKPDRRNYVNKRTAYNQGNMFICKSKKLIIKYYETIFKWLGECEKIFGFDLDNYGKIRIYGFLAERFLPFWFKKYSNYLEWPIIFSDLRKENLD